MSQLTEQLFTAMSQGKMGKNVQIPPPAIKHLDPTLLEHIPEKSIKWAFPIKENYNNPFGITFGGYYGMFFDAAFGPFSGLTAKKPTTSLDMNITFLKPLSPKDKTVIVEAKVVSKSKSYLLLSAEAHSESGVLVATCTSRMLILDR
ncbi:MAG: PaaI family thioesterase [Bacteroidota bacterium]